MPKRKNKPEAATRRKRKREAAFVEKTGIAQPLLPESSIYHVSHPKSTYACHLRDQGFLSVFKVFMRQYVATVPASEDKTVASNFLNLLESCPKEGEPALEELLIRRYLDRNTEEQLFFKSFRGLAGLEVE